MARTERVQVGMSEAECAELDDCARREGKTRSKCARDAILAHVRRPRLSGDFLRGLEARAPDDVEVDMVYAAWLALRSRDPQAKEMAHQNLEELIRYVRETAERTKETTDG